MMTLRAGTITSTTPVKRRMGIQQALEWAFGREKAQLDLGTVDPENPERQAVGTEWIIYQRHLLGATVDSSGPRWGGSMPHHDAEVIAAFVAALPEAHGGRAMAARIAELASAGITPDWMPGAIQRIVPVDWKDSRYGRFASTEVVPKDVPGRWLSVGYGKNGRRVRREPTWCPVTYSPTAQQIGRARRAYLDWWGALLHLGFEARSCGMLGSVEITTAMPRMTPWRQDA